MLSFFVMFCVSFIGTYWVLPHSIRKLRENRHVCLDMYKSGKVEIPTNGGMIILFTSYISITLLPLFVRVINQTNVVQLNMVDLSETSLAFLLVVSVYALYGLVDDLVDIGRKLKLILPIAFGYPLITIINPESLWVPLLGDFDLNSKVIENVSYSDLFRITIIPIYVMVVANLVNMHSGYNGLQSGLSIIIMTTLVIESWFDGKTEAIIPVGSFLGAMCAFWIFNKYPSSLFEGNIGSLLFGSIIGSIIVIQSYWWFGFFILIPHSINFVLWLFWLYLMRVKPEEYLKADGKHKKFGRVREDGTIAVPNRLTLKWIPNYYFNLSEPQSTLISFSITLFFCIVGILIF